MNEDKATRYQRLQRRASIAGTVASALFLLLLTISGASAGLRQLVTRVTGDSFLATVAGYVTALILLHELLQLPFAFYQGVTLERRYELSTETTTRWWKDQLKAFAVGLVLALAAAVILWLLIRWNPDRWWIPAAIAFALILVLMAQLAPVVLLPLFYKLQPLDRPELTARLLALADHAGTPVLGVFEWRVSGRTRKANAALAGLGRTRRILLSDTLLGDYSDEEIEVILAHELAHHVFRDIWSAIALESGLIVVGLFVADRVLTAFAGAFGLAGKSDIAALPLLVLAMGAVSLGLLPLANAFSRSHERRADQYALQMTRNAEAFVSAMKRLSAQNLAEEQPSRLVEVLFHSHPPMRARIESAREFARHSPA